MQKATFGTGISNFRDYNFVTGFWLLAASFWLLASGYWLLAFGF
jgi:high-affinity Fe2+/Pb2+ permease